MGLPADVHHFSQPQGTSGQVQLAAVITQLA